MKKGVFSKDFTLVVIGQVISLFGNATVRFALPLYLLNQTGSAAVYGTVTACAFIPAVLLSPVGGIVADRVNKRNVMVILDFFTGCLILACSLLLGKMNLIVLLAATLMLLYGIAGAYQPSVQASIPVLVDRERIMEANSIVNAVNSLANLTGPVIGGILYSAYGLGAVLWICIVCFFASAVMEVFIHIPFVRQASRGGILQTAKADFSESIGYIRKDKPVIGKVMLVVCGINLFLSALILVGMPYLITEVLELEAAWSNKLYGFAQGALAAGGLAGGICAGIFAEKLSVKKVGNLIVACALSLFPVGLTLMLCSSGMVNYLVLTVCCFVIMVLSTICGVQLLSFIQTETPQNLIGKVIAVTLTISMCAQPLGNALYGVLFEVCGGMEFVVILFAGGVSLAISYSTKNIFEKL
ncbi:MFS transporter [Lachnospiraceae bacterium 50-23]|jgi:MFS family permease|nr:MFS transporter [Dorea sp.]GFI36841.1 lysophospholipid transporter LplT [Lachnospiraceae bacterium]